MFIITGIGGNDRNFKGENKMSNVSTYHLDRLIDNVFNSYANSTTAYANHTNTWYAWSTDFNYLLEATMVGISKSDLKVSIVDNSLVIEGTPSVKSRFATAFKRSWTLAKDADVSNIDARLENGLLTLTIPRVKPATRTVNVTIQ